MGFLLFVLVNAALFIRPSEIVPALEAIPIYNILISSCLLVSLPVVQKELTGRSLVETPITPEVAAEITDEGGAEAVVTEAAAEAAAETPSPEQEG